MLSPGLSVYTAPYPGVCGDAQYISGRTEAGFWGVLWGAFDIVPSALFDTVALPHDLNVNANHGKKRREAYIRFLTNKIGSYRTGIVLTDTKRINQRTLLAVQQDPARKAELEAESKRLGTDIDSKQDQIKSLENEIELIRTKKQPVPKFKTW